METQSPDTDPAAEAFLFEAYRRMGPAGRLRRAAELRAAALRLAELEELRRHPGLDARTLRVRVAARWLPRELLARAFPDVDLGSPE